jgi:DNA-binding HxlR family transcriptional regulator
VERRNPWNLRNKTLRFSQLKRKLNGVTQKMLTQQLRELEEDGLIIKRYFLKFLQKLNNSLTEYGKTIVPVLYSIYQWGIKYSCNLM